jgi:hypothetical protein
MRRATPIGNDDRPATRGDLGAPGILVELASRYPGDPPRKLVYGKEPRSGWQIVAAEIVIMLTAAYGSTRVDDVLPTERVRPSLSADGCPEPVDGHDVDAVRVGERA